MRLAAVALLALMMSACTNSATTGSTPNPDATPPPASSEPTPSPSTSAAPSEESSPPQDVEAVACEQVMFQRAQNTIRNQQAAFANEDFEAARGFASQSFQSTVNAEQFQRIIEGSYGFLLGSPELEFLDCRRIADTAFLQVKVSGTPDIFMAYSVVLEGEAWFIDGAVIAGSREDVTT